MEPCSAVFGSFERINVADLQLGRHLWRREVDEVIEFKCSAVGRQIRASGSSSSPSG